MGPYLLSLELYQQKEGAMSRKREPISEKSNGLGFNVTNIESGDWESTNEKSQEDCVRRLAMRNGYVVRKSRQWKNVPNPNNHGEYMLVDARTNIPVCGSYYDATLDDLELFLTN